MPDKAIEIFRIGLDESLPERNTQIKATETCDNKKHQKSAYFIKIMHFVQFLDTFIF